MWKIKHIFDGDYGCEEHDDREMMVSVTIANESGEERMVSAADVWLRENNLDIGSEWPKSRSLVLETSDLILKKAEWSDWADIYHNLWCHEESAKYMLWNVTRSETEALDRIDRTLRFQKDHEHAYFVYEKKTGRAIGFAGMIELEPGVFEDIGVAVGPDFTGKGYGTQILGVLVDEARRCGAHKFIGTCRKQNIASHRLQMRCGFQFSHDEDRVDPRDGSPYVLEFNELIIH